MTLRLTATALLAAAAVAAAGCAAPPAKSSPQPARPATRPGEGPAPALPPLRSFGDLSAYPRSPEQVSGPAVLSLLQDARAALEQGQSEQAVARLETALDIEPRNPFVWQQLADAHLRQDLPDQAEQQAQRSNSFAHGNPFIELGNWRVIAQAREKRGDRAGAEQAQARVQLLEEALED